MTTAVGEITSYRRLEDTAPHGAECWNGRLVKKGAVVCKYLSPSLSAAGIIFDSTCLGIIATACVAGNQPDHSLFYTRGMIVVGYPLTLATFLTWGLATKVLPKQETRMTTSCLQIRLITQGVVDISAFITWITADCKTKRNDDTGIYLTFLMYGPILLCIGSTLLTIYQSTRRNNPAPLVL